MKKHIFIIFWIVIAITNYSTLFAANLILSENFNTQTFDPRLIARQVDVSGSISPPKFVFSTPGRGGTGFAFSSGSVHDAFLEWRFNNKWYTDELYVSFWMRYPSRIYPDGDNHWNIKTFYPHFDGTGSYVHYATSGGGSVYYSARSGLLNTMIDQSKWLSIPNAFDGKWHRYEFFIKFSEGISRFWYDGTLVSNYTYGPGRWTNNIYYITFAGSDAETKNQFSREIDDIEVWDGMPTSPQPISNPPAPSSLAPPTGLTVKELN
jgi:hypothetical protein